MLNGCKSEWNPVSSGVPQGSVLGPLLFIIYINDIDKGLSSRLFKFADDCKLVKRVCNTADCIALQRDLDIIMGWSAKWGMPFNVNKCGILNAGVNNAHFAYRMEDEWLEEKEKERDLGIIVDRDFNFKEQCLNARNRANKILGFINRNVSYKSKNVIRQLYNSYVRPHIEYCVQAWRPHLRHDINMLESVQRRATKLIPSLKNMPYEDRLEELNMFSVEYRFLRGDMIEIYKILTGKSGIKHN